MKTVLPGFSVLMFCLGATAGAVADDGASRKVLSLDGVWSIAEGRMDAVPTRFDRTVPVPGLTTLATPAFAPAPGPKVANREAYPQKDPARDAFWYRRTFLLDQSVPAVARLKVAKAMFGSQAILNGRVLRARACRQLHPRLLRCASRAPAGRKRAAHPRRGGPQRGDAVSAGRLRLREGSLHPRHL